MFEFMTYTSYLFFDSTDPKINAVDTTPIHFSVQNMAVRAAELTVQQFNQACEAVCNEPVR